VAKKDYEKKIGHNAKAMNICVKRFMYWKRVANTSTHIRNRAENGHTAISSSYNMNA
jgi:hypothetical protein